MNPIKNPSPATRFDFPIRNKLRFVASYVAHKTFLLFRDVEHPRTRLFVYEIIYSLCRALGRPPLPLRWLDIRRIKSRFGTFDVRPGTIDAACASPAFERLDIDRLGAEVAVRLAAGKRVVFADVGADIGTYTITIARRAPHGANLHVVAFEPSQESFSILEKNIDLNGLGEHVAARRLACDDGSATSATLTFDELEPGSSGIRTDLVHGTSTEVVSVSTIDKELTGIGDGAVLVLKLDVEGYEVAVLRGATDTIDRAEESLLLVEDFVDDRVVEYLQRSGWEFVDKLTPYNSFWRTTRTS